MKASLFSMTTILVVLASSGMASATPITVTETATYAMGDGDSRTSAREACHGKARSQALQKMGSLVETNLETSMEENAAENSAGPRNAATARTRALSVGIVRSEPQDESTALDIQGRVIQTCTVRVTVDPDQVAKATETAARDDLRLQAAEQRIAKLEAELKERDTRDKISAPPPPIAPTLPPPAPAQTNSAPQPPAYVIQTATALPPPQTFYRVPYQMITAYPPPPAVPAYRQMVRYVSPRRYLIRGGERYDYAGGYR